MVEYWLNKNGTLQKSQTINITVDADSAYATVCWVGVIRNTDGCIGDDVQNYCESIYIGVNTSCSDDKQTSGTTSWYDCRITYKIIQSKRTDCEDCGSNTSTCELIDAYVSPYYVSTDTTATTVYYQYWKTTKNECEVISRVIENDSQEVNIDPSGVACDSDDRTISVPSISYCDNKTIDGLTCYVQKPDNCCEQGEVTECYEINDIYYNPQKVDYSGGSVGFYFDYKKITYKDCKKIETFGRFQDSVQVPRCDGNDCCRERTRVIQYVWNGHTLCSGGNIINLEIKQKKDLNYVGECKCEVEHPDTGYCVNVDSVKRYYNNNGIWTEINPLASNPYVFPYYGGTMKVTWGYSAITVNDDCTSAVTSGNVWEDYIDILPYDGDECDDGTPEDTSVTYKFKKSPCDFKTDAKDILPSYICNGNNCINEFDIQYQQYKKPCSDVCESCLTKFNIELDSGGTVTSSDTATCNILLVDESKPQWLTVSVNGRNVSYSAPLNSGSTREGGVTFKLNNEECYDTVIVRQIGSSQDKDTYPEDPTVECDCDNAFFEAYSAQTALSKNGGEHIFIGSYIFNDCIKDVSIPSDCSISYDEELTCSGGTVTFKNVSTASDYTISYDEELTCSGGDVTFTATKVESSFVSNVSFENGAIYADIEKNETSEERTYELPISYTVENCGDKEASIMVKQKKGNEPAPSDCALDGATEVNVPVGDTAVTFGFHSECDGVYKPLEVVDSGTLENVVISNTHDLEGSVDAVYTSSTLTQITLKQVNGDKTLTTKVFRQQPSSNISVTFTLVNGTPNEINGTVEIFCDGISESFTVPDFTVGSTPVSKVKELDSTYENASITLAEFQSGAGNKRLTINGTNALSDGGTIYLYYNN